MQRRMNLPLNKQLIMPAQYSKPKWKDKMTPTKFQLKKLERALDRAAKLANLHGEAVRVATQTFEETFDVAEVPEDAKFLQVTNSKEEVGSLFNEMVSHGENMAGNTTEALVARMAELMAMEEDE